MSEEQYQKLNEYMNDLFQVLEENNAFLLRKIRNITYVSEDCMKKLKSVPNQDYFSQNYLDIMEVYALGREIIESLCSCYLEQYNQIMNNGELNFDYDEDAQSYFYFNLHKQQFKINVNRHYDYRTVVELIHEFIHSTSEKQKRSNTGYLLTEFMSIYFELKAILYLNEIKGIPMEELPMEWRIKNAYRCANFFGSYSCQLTSYELFGEVHPNVIPLLSESLFPINEIQFTEENKALLEKFEKLEKKYQMETMYEENPIEWKYYLLKHSSFDKDYRYFLGICLAFYALEHCRIEDILYLNQHMNEMDDVVEALCSIGIDLNDENPLQESLNSMKHMIEKYSEIKRK